MISLQLDLFEANEISKKKGQERKIEKYFVTDKENDEKQHAVSDVNEPTGIMNEM